MRKRIVALLLAAVFSLNSFSAYAAESQSIKDLNADNPGMEFFTPKEENSGEDSLQQLPEQESEQREEPNEFPQEDLIVPGSGATGVSGEEASEVTPADIKEPEVTSGDAKEPDEEEMVQTLLSEEKISKEVVSAISETVDEEATTVLLVKTWGDVSTIGAKSIFHYENVWALGYSSAFMARVMYYVFSMSPNVDSVEYDAVVQTADLMADAKESQLEGEASELKKYLDGLQYVGNSAVAVLDTGIDEEEFRYPERVINSGVNISTTGNSGSINDDNGHGTRVASMVAENSNEAVKIVPIKIANAEGEASILSAYIGMKEAIRLQVDVINLSMVAVDSVESAILKSVIDEASMAGITVVVAAGNEHGDVDGYAPANVESAITVGATDVAGELKGFTNFGDAIDYAAVGENGTSEAAAFVSGIIAQIKSAYPWADQKCVRSILNELAQDLGFDGWDVYYGNGWLSYNVSQQKSFTPPVEDEDSKIIGSGLMVQADKITITEYPQKNGEFYVKLKKDGKEATHKISFTVVDQVGTQYFAVSISAISGETGTLTLAQYASDSQWWTEPDIGWDANKYEESGRYYTIVGNAAITTFPGYYALGYAASTPDTGYAVETCIPAEGQTQIRVDANYCNLTPWYEEAYHQHTGIIDYLPKTYNFAYNANGGSGSITGASSLGYGDTHEVKSGFSRSHYDFKGYHLQRAADNKWRTRNGWSDSESDAKIFSVDDTVKIESGWDSATNATSETYTFYAQWERDYHTMTTEHYYWKLNSGSTTSGAYPSSADDKVTNSVQHGKKFTPSWKEKEGYEHDTSKTGNGSNEYTVASNHTFKLYYKLKQYKMTVKHYKWVYNDGSPKWEKFQTVEDTVYHGITYTPQYVTSPTGYHTKSIDAAWGPVTGPKTFKAYYDPNVHTVTYNYAENGGDSATKTSESINYSWPVDLTPTATKSGDTGVYSVSNPDGWQFVGWNTDKDATVGLTSLTMPDNDVTLYAIYKKTITATFTDYQETTQKTESKSETVYNKTTTATITKTQNQATGWTAIGWCTGTEPTATVITNFCIYQDTQYYGKYKRVVTVRFHNFNELQERQGDQFVNSFNFSNRTGVTVTTTPLRRKYAWTGVGWTANTKELKTKTYDENVSITVMEDADFYAIYFRDYTVTFVSDQGARVPEPISARGYYNTSGEQGAAVVDVPNGYDYKGVKFVCWNTSLLMSGRRYNAGDKLTLTYDMILYTRYVKIPVPPPDIPELEDDAITMLVGEEEKLTAKLGDEVYNQNVNWSSEDSSIATVDQNGVVKGISDGTTVLTVAAKSAPEVKMHVYVRVVGCAVRVPSIMTLDQPVPLAVTVYGNDYAKAKLYMHAISGLVNQQTGKAYVLYAYKQVGSKFERVDVNDCLIETTQYSEKPFKVSTRVSPYSLEAGNYSANVVFKLELSRK